MSLSRRPRILKQWLCGKRSNVSLLELIKNVFEPSCDTIARRFIKEIKEDGGYLEVYFHGIKYPLYYPEEMPIHNLYQVIKEAFCPDDWNYYEVEETKVGREDVVLDCGAAEGLFSLLVAGRCRKVYAIEPLPRFVESMKRSFAHFRNIEIIPCALSDKKGKGKMSDDSIMSSLENQMGETIEINIDTVDNLFYQKDVKISYIKADLEGSEMNMLRGSYNTIKNNRPKIAITTYHKAKDAVMITAFLKNIDPNYKIKYKGIEGGAGSPVMLHAWMD